MKGTDLIKVLRKVVREEVRAVVKEELTEILRDGLQSTITEMARSEKPVQKFAKAKPAPLPPSTPLVTMEGPLGDILRDTANSMAKNPALMEGFDDEWPDMNGGTFKAEQAPAMGMMAMMNDLDNIQTKPSQQQMRAAMTGDPTQAFMKDYSSVLKKANEIAEANHR